MTSIPPNFNIAGTLAQSQVSATESSRSQDAQRNKQAADSRQLDRLSQQQQDEVENTEETDPLRVHRRGEGDSEKQRNQQNPGENPSSHTLYDASGSAHKSEDADESTDSDSKPHGHIDLNA